MARNGGTPRPAARTLLEVKIRERNMTLEEFAEHAEAFSREHRDTGTLSVRHLQRLIAGTDPRRVRPATRRLLEEMLDTPADELLQPRTRDAEEDGGEGNDWHRSAAELDRFIAAAQRVDSGAIELLARQIDIVRKLDRRFGAATLLGTLRLHARHLEELMSHSSGHTHRVLAAVLTDAHTLAGWQSLDRGEPTAAWTHYCSAADAARAAESPALLAHALAEQAVVLADIGRTRDAAQLSAQDRALGESSAPLLRSWLAAAHGEALAADNRPHDSLDAFDNAHALLPDRADRLDDGPYLALDPVHLARWRGHALARFGRSDAIAVLSDALERHDVEFVRAEAGLRTDLVLAHLFVGEREAARQGLTAARRSADAVGSARQSRRLARAATVIAS